MAFRIKDKVWVQQSFLLPQDALADTDRSRRVSTTAAFKFTDTTIGGNFAINAPPQFTRFADIRVGGSDRHMYGATNTQGGVKWMRSTGYWFAEGDHPNARYTSPSAGMGRYYSESIDDFGQDLVMRFGVPEYNSLTQFFGNFYSSQAAMTARTGRTLDVFATAGRAAGFLLALPLQPLILGGQIIKFLGNWPASKYYYMKPTMYPYWSAVNTIVNGIAVNIGLIPQGLTPGQAGIMGVSNDDAAQEQAMNEYAKILPDVFLGGRTVGQGGQAMGLDVYAIASRAQRIANAFNEMVAEKVDSLQGAHQLGEAIKELRQRFFLGGGLKSISTGGIEAYRKVYLESERNNSNNTSYITLNGEAADSATADLTGAPSGEAGGAAAPTQELTSVDVESANPDGTRPWYNMGSAQGGPAPGTSWFGSLRAMFEGERRDGAQFVTFRVGYSGSTGESFSSSVEESQIAQKFNSTSSSARSARFDWANGADLNRIPGVSQVLDATKSFLAGTLEGVHMSGLLALAGNAFVDIPKTWSGSTAQLPRAEYTIKLRSPYGSKMSRMMNLYIPLAMLLAGALPLSTGKRSYTSPFICEAFCRGRHAIRLGMIDSMSITRGVGNMGWSMEGEALGIDVTFSIVDLSTVMHMPITTNFGLTDKLLQAVGDATGTEELATWLQKGTYDDDNSFTDYLAVLGSLSWQDLIYANRRWRLARYRQMQHWQSWKSPARVASWIGHTNIGRFINAISLETERPD